MKNMQVPPAKIIEPDLFLPRSLSQISRIYCGCAGFGQIFRSFSWNSPAIRFKQSKYLTQTATSSQRSLISDWLLALLIMGKTPILGSCNLETAVGSQKSAQALGAPGKIKNYLITTEVTTNFFISPGTPISYTAVLRPTTVSRFMRGPRNV